MFSFSGVIYYVNFGSVDILVYFIKFVYVIIVGIVFKFIDGFVFEY